MPAYYDEARKRWRYRFRGRIAGVKVCITGTPATNAKRAAETEERLAIEARRRELENPRLARKVPTLKEWADTYLARVERDCARTTWALRDSAMRVHWIPRFGTRSIDKITRADVEAAVDELIAEGYASNTVHNMATTLLMCLRAAQRAEIIDAVPAPELPRLKHRDDFLSEEETSRLLAACDTTEERAAVALGARGGLRRGEIRGVQWQDWQPDARTLRVQRQVTKFGIKEPKGGRKRRVPVHADLAHAMAAHQAAADPIVPWVLHRNGEPLTLSALDTLLAAVVKRAGIDRKVIWHLLRHTCASHLACRGESLQIIGEILGHKSLNTTQRYAHLCPAVTILAIDRIPATVATEEEPGQPSGKAKQLAA